MGFRTAFARYPEDGLAIAVLTNRADAEPSAFVDRIADQCQPDRGSSRLVNTIRITNTVRLTNGIDNDDDGLLDEKRDNEARMLVDGSANPHLIDLDKFLSAYRYREEDNTIDQLSKG